MVDKVEVTSVVKETLRIVDNLKKKDIQVADENFGKLFHTEPSVLRERVISEYEMLKPE